MAVKELHKRSMHIDAPVERVFDYVKEPRHFLEAFPEQDRRHMALAEVNLAPEAGVGSTYRLMGRMLLFFHMEWTLTREEYVPNERFVDHANLGGVWTLTFEPDETGTTLSVAFGWSSKVPFVADLMDLGWEGDSDLDAMLATIKTAIES
jgi:uncharacterized protein YndB with AHSA1/START domain